MIYPSLAFVTFAKAHAQLRSLPRRDVTYIKYIILIPKYKKSSLQGRELERGVGLDKNLKNYYYYFPPPRNQRFRSSLKWRTWIISIFIQKINPSPEFVMLHLFANDSDLYPGRGEICLKSSLWWRYEIFSFTFLKIF